MRSSVRVWLEFWVCGGSSFSLCVFSPHESSPSFADSNASRDSTRDLTACEFEFEKDPFLVCFSLAFSPNCQSLADNITASNNTTVIIIILCSPTGLDVDLQSFPADKNSSHRRRHRFIHCLRVPLLCVSLHLGEKTTFPLKRKTKKLHTIIDAM